MTNPDDQQQILITIKTVPRMLVKFFLFLTLTQIIVFSIRTIFGRNKKRVLYSILPLPLIISSIVLVKNLLQTLVVAFLLNEDLTFLIGYILFLDLDLILMPTIYSIFCNRKYLFMFIQSAIILLATSLVYWIDESDLFEKYSYMKMFFVSLIVFGLCVALFYVLMIIIDTIFSKNNENNESKV